MFGIGTPPLPAAPNSARAGSVTCLAAVLLAGKRPFAAASLACALDCDMKLPTRSRAAGSMPWPAANLVTMKPCTPRNGTDGQSIFGIWTTLNGILASLIDAMFHGPVIQKAALPERNDCCATPLSTFELTRPSLLQAEIWAEFLRKPRS